MNQKQLKTNISQNMHRALRVLAAEKESSMKDVVLTAIKDFPELDAYDDEQVYGKTLIVIVDDDVIRKLDRIALAMGANRSVATRFALARFLQKVTV